MGAHVGRSKGGDCTVWVKRLKRPYGTGNVYMCMYVTCTVCCKHVVMLSSNLYLFVATCTQHSEYFVRTHVERTAVNHLPTAQAGGPKAFPAHLRSNAVA